MGRVAAHETWVPPARAVYQLFGTWFLPSIFGNLNLKQPTQNGAPPPSAPSILKKIDGSQPLIPSRTHPERAGTLETEPANARGAGNVSSSRSAHHCQPS
jgi:hypothetical protein